MTLWLENRVAIVTGAGRGIGQATAMLLAKEGARVVVNDLGCEIDGSSTSGGPADSVVKEIRELGGEAVANYTSVATMDGAKSIAQCALENFGRIDILVSLAGVERGKAFIDTTEDDFDALVATHLKGHFGCLKAVLPHMIAQKYGRIINISSGAILGTIGEVVYGAVKSAILGLTRGLAKEVKEYGITVNAIMPAARTRMTAAAASSAAVKQPSGIGTDQPPETIAPLIAYLASERAGKITGRTIALRYARTVQLMSDPTPVGSAYTAREAWTIEELDKVMPRLVPGIE